MGIPKEELVSLTCYGTGGSLSLENWTDLRACRFGEDWTAIVSRNSTEPPVHLTDLITNTVRAIRGEEADLIDFQTGYEIQQILDRILHIS